eukprot:gnl/TRDRNA2_/TRDRNA2_132627_c2_seq1.p1 gnl/TRDRNA2_/TRDRNA2_132627_c2~~gnl/TRDRNA2_/TRDRNA2_132627_c2_seq1.p1  ORF type:complete len:454 (+),score=92.80 gnl/TRDRNA2_/TRDRNA2_132627_c2_seq1:45-1364(+)
MAVAILAFAALSSAEHASNGEPLVVELHKESARQTPEQRDAKVAQKSFYVGTVSVGVFHTQELKVIFDTAAGNSILPAADCNDTSCKEHKTYSRKSSPSAIDIDSQGHPMNPSDDVRDGANIVWDNADVGEGEAMGPLVQDIVCFKGSTQKSMCTHMGLVTAKEMSEVPFRQMPNDGIIGLGLTGTSIGPSFNFLKQLANTNAGFKRRFGIFLAADGSGAEIAFGGIDRKHLAEKLTWVPVTNPEQGYWQVSILEVRFGDQKLYDCRSGDCKGIVDMGTSRLGVPAPLAPTLEAALGVREAAPRNGLLVSGRKCRSPDLHLDLGGATLTLQAEDYAGPACAPMLAPTKDQWPTKTGTFILGEPFLKRYYTAFDWEKMRIGFGKATGTLDSAHALVDDEDDDLTAATAEPASPETRTIILLQVKFQRTKFVEDDDDDIRG